MKFTAAQIAEVLQGRVEGNPDITVSDFAKIEEGKPGTLTFLHNPKYAPFIYETKASVCIVNEDFKPEKPIGLTLIRVGNAYRSMSQLLEYYDQLRKEKSGREEPHFISESANLGENVYIGAFAYIAKNVEIGDNVKIYPQVFIGDNVKIGSNTTLYSGVKIYHDIVIGQRCVIHSNAVLGADGFGFVPDENGVYKKVPQIGNIVIEDDVEIGAGTTIDRATMGSSYIRKGVKLDNLIQIAHNVEIDQHTAIAAQTGIAGSTKIGKHSIFGGQVGISGHLKIGNQVRVQAQAGIGRDIKDGEAVQGSPAIGYSDYNRSYVHFKNLPKIVNRLNQLEKKLNDDGGKSE